MPSSLNIQQHHVGPSPNSKKVLVADDSIALRKLLVLTLLSGGYDITEAVDGRVALEKAQADTFDVIITDHNMPEMDGVTLIRNLRALPQYQGTPILVLTIETSDDLKARAKAAGASGWIVKPVHPDSILTAIERVLQGRRQS